MRRFYLAVLLLVSCFMPLRAESALPENIELSAKLDLFAAQASTPKYFLQDYKQAAAKFGIDFNYYLAYNLRFVFLPYVQTFYDINNTDRTQTKARIWQGYFEYLLDDFTFTIGRFTFEDEHLAPFIYYGADAVKDLALPTALDGLKHSFGNAYFAYTILAAKETEIEEYSKAKLVGTKIEAYPLSWLNVAAFGFYQNKKYDAGIKNINSDLFIYGGGFDLMFSEDAGFNFYFAYNGGNKETKRLGITTKEDYKGYAFNGELYFQKSYKAGILDSKVGAYVFSDSDKEFAPFAQELNMGIIYCGMNYGNVFTPSPQIIYMDFLFKPNKYPHLFIGAGIFRYASEKNALNNHTYYASEFNLKAGAEFDNWGLKISGGLFEGEAIFLGVSSKEQQRIKKIQLNFFYKLDI